MRQTAPVGAAGCGEEVYGWCCADGAPAGGDRRRVCGGEGRPLGELLEPLFLRKPNANTVTTRPPASSKRGGPGLGAPSALLAEPAPLPGPPASPAHPLW